MSLTIDFNVFSSMKDTWTILKDYPYYSISEAGEVKNNKTGRLLKPSPVKGYYMINMYIDTVRTSVSLHRLLAQTFIPNPDNLPLVDHVDRNTVNNALGNLRWVTVQHNMFNKRGSDTSTSQLIGASWCNTNLKWAAQIQINKKNKFLGYFATDVEAHNAYMAAKKDLHIIPNAQ